MRIGDFVHSQVPSIFECCQTDPNELSRLMDRDYSNKVFKLNWPFCAAENEIPAKERERYWTTRPFRFAGKTLFVCSQWYPRNREPFYQYLRSKGITIPESALANGGESATEPRRVISPRRASGNTSKIRFKATTEGDAANAVVRAILSNLGDETFTEADWEETKVYFHDRCAYYDESNPRCSEGKPTDRDHIIPINKDNLGEHRRGNYVPSCKACNKRKHRRDFRDVFRDQPETVQQIIEFMAKREYSPLSGNQQIKVIADQAYNEVKALVYRYVAIIEAALAADRHQGSGHDPC